MDGVEGSDGIDRERREGLVAKSELQDGANVQVAGDGQPNNWYNIPSGLAEYLRKLSVLATDALFACATHLKIGWPKEGRRVREVARLVDLLEVVGLAPVRIPHLAQHGLAEVEELVLLIVLVRIRLLRVEVVFGYPVCGIRR